MTWKLTRNFYGIYKKYQRKNQPERSCQWATSPKGATLGRAWQARGAHVAPPTSSPPPYKLFRPEKNQREEIIAFYDMEPTPPPVLRREGRSGVRSGLRRVEIEAIVIINHPPSPIS